MSKNTPDYLNTQSIKYAGSKLKLLPYISSLTEGLEIKSILDGFAGSTRVSQMFAKKGYDVISNDISEWSSVLGNCYLKNTKSIKYYQGIIDHLNNVKGYDGWFTENYGGLPNGGLSVQSDGLKKVWQVKNTRKLDAIRDEIDSLNLPYNEKCVVLTSLILSLDKVDNTIGHFTSYLKNWSSRSYDNLKLEVPMIFKSSGNNRVIKGDVFDVLDNFDYDFAYFDPPYGSNNEKTPSSRVRYNSYYHLWTTVIRNDKPEIFGKAKRREDSRDLVSGSVFEEYKKDKNGKFIAVNAIEKLINSTNARYIGLSYSTGGRATSLELESILNKSGKILKIMKIDYKKNIMSSMVWTGKWVNELNTKYSELLFLIEKK